MIALLRGQVIEREGTSVVIDVQGVGYQAFCSRTCLSSFEIGDQVTLTIYTEVREDAIRLYGFINRLEKQVFLLLNLVKGIGPKSALEIVSCIEARELLRFIGAGDIKSLQGVKGIGKKTAERLVVELKDRVGGYAMEQHEILSGDRTTTTGGPYQDAILALQALGFSKKDAERAVSEIQKTGVQHEDSGVIVREALRYI